MQGRALRVTSCTTFLNKSVRVVHMSSYNCDVLPYVHCLLIYLHWVSLCERARIYSHELIDFQPCSADVPFVYYANNFYAFTTKNIYLRQTAHCSCESDSVKNNLMSAVRFV